VAKKRDRLKGAQQRRRRLGLDHVRKHRYPCGLCGTETRLTKTHVPPQCAGNTGLVFRQFFLIGTGQILRRGGRQIGGLHVYGLCQDCNGLQALYDGAYGEFAQALYPCWIRGDLAIPGGRMEIPEQDIAPGAIARSVVIGMFGLNANLRELYPQLAISLCQRVDSIELPNDIQLRLALARGTTARVTGSMLGYGLLTGVGFSTMAQVYFPPLAWQLADDCPSSVLQKSSLLDRQGWADVSNWISYAPTHRRNLRSLARSLPAVVYPHHDQALASDWTELFADSITFILGCDEVPDFRL
jgi:hypothetical protein